MTPPTHTRLVPKQYLVRPVVGDVDVYEVRGHEVEGRIHHLDVLLRGGGMGMGMWMGAWG